MQITNANIQDLKEKVTDYVRKDIAQMTEDVANAKEEYLFLMHFDDASVDTLKISARINLECKRHYVKSYSMCPPKLIILKSC